MNIFVKKWLAFLGLYCFGISIASALTITNISNQMENYYSHMQVEIKDTSGNWVLDLNRLPYLDSFSLGMKEDLAHTTRSQTPQVLDVAFIYASRGGTWLTFKVSLNDVPSCEFQPILLEHPDEYARASESCAYTQNCVDKKPYNDSTRSSEDFKAYCLPCPAGRASYDPYAPYCQ